MERGLRLIFALAAGYAVLVVALMVCALMQVERNFALTVIFAVGTLVSAVVYYFAESIIDWLGDDT